MSLMRTFRHYVSLKMQRSLTQETADLFVAYAADDNLEELKRLHQRYGDILLDAVNRYQKTALLAATDNIVSKQCLDYLVKAGAKLDNAVRDDEITPLMNLSFSNQVEGVTFLLQNKASPYSRGKDFSTALHWAAWGCAADVIPLLLQAGADVNAQTNNNATPLILTIANIRSREPEAQMASILSLLQAGANPCLRNKNDVTAADVAEDLELFEAATMLRHAEKEWETREKQAWIEKEASLFHHAITLPADNTRTLKLRPPALNNQRATP